MHRVGTSDLYYTYYDQPRPYGGYWVGRGTKYGWDMVKVFKTAAAAKKYAIRMAGTDTYHD